MSWQAYIDTSLVGSGHVDKGAIYGLNGGGLWAATPGFDVSPEELKILTDALESNNYDNLHKDGLIIAGTRYVLLRGEGRSIIARQGKDGIVIAKTKKAILIAHHNKDMIACNCSITVEGLADYLEDLGY